jgi:hypothetical protein
MAAAAGATVTAVTKDTRYGTVAQATETTRELAEQLKVADRITVTDQRSAELFAAADVITNSGHVRPISGAFADAIRPDAVLSLMFESWEIQAGRYDLDLDALRGRGVRIAGTNERHPDVDVFSFLGPMAVAQLADAGVSAYRGRVALLCDNPFNTYMRNGLEAAGAVTSVSADLGKLLQGPRPDALIVAMRPTGGSILTAEDVDAIAARWPDVVIAQYWGDLDRDLLAAADLRCWPLSPPGSGHMGVLPSRVGPEPIVRLQAGGLKVAQVLLKSENARTADDLAYLDPL